VRVNHYRRHIIVPQQLLDRANIRAPLQRMRRETVPEGMARHPFDNPRSRHRALDGSVDRQLVDVMAPYLPRTRVDRQPPGRKGVLPTLLPRSSGIFPVQRSRQVYSPEAVVQVILMH
jgi:hypothetical protein